MDRGSARTDTSQKRGCREAHMPPTREGAPNVPPGRHPLAQMPCSPGRACCPLGPGQSQPRQRVQGGAQSTREAGPGPRKRGGSRCSRAGGALTGSPNEA